MREIARTVFEVGGRELPTKQHAEAYERESARKQEWGNLMDLCELEVHEDHLKLMRQLNVDWRYCEFGAPAIDPKRPYGTSDVYEDIAKILGLPPQNDDTWEYPQEQVDYMLRRHAEMKHFLQILFVFGEIPSGKYRRKATYYAWEKVA